MQITTMQQKQPLRGAVQKLTFLLFFKFASDHNPWKLHVKQLKFSKAAGLQSATLL